LSFESDALAIRKAISSFGHVRTVKSTTAKSFESLPAQLEDYDEEDDNDYEANYFDNGEEENDDLGDGGGGDDGGDDAYD